MPTSELAAALALVVSVPFMLLVRSMTRTTSTGLVGAVPHGPLHADETTTPGRTLVDPHHAPEAERRVRGARDQDRVAAVADGRVAGGEPGRPEPDEVGRDRRIVARARSAGRTRAARRARCTASPGCERVDPDQALVADRVRRAREPRVVGLDRRRDESVDRGGFARDRAVDRQQRAAGQGGRVERVDQRLAVVPQQPDIDDQRREREDDDQHEREQDDDLSSLTLPVPRKFRIRVLCRVMCGALRARSLEDHLDRRAHRDR